MHTKGMESRLVNMATNHTEDIKQHTAKQTSLLAKKAGKVISEEIHKTKKKLENSINQEVIKVTESQLNSFHKLGTQLQDVHENQEKTQGKFNFNFKITVSFSRFTYLVVHVKKTVFMTIVHYIYFLCLQFVSFCYTFIGIN